MSSAQVCFATKVITYYGEIEHYIIIIIITAHICKMNGFYAYTYQVAHKDKRAISTSDALELRNTFHKKIGNWSRWFLDSQISERRCWDT